MKSSIFCVMALLCSLNAIAGGASSKPKGEETPRPIIKEKSRHVIIQSMRVITAGPDGKPKAHRLNSSGLLDPSQK